MTTEEIRKKVKAIDREIKRLQAERSQLVSAPANAPPATADLLKPSLGRVRVDPGYDPDARGAAIGHPSYRSQNYNRGGGMSD